MLKRDLLIVIFFFFCISTYAENIYLKQHNWGRKTYYISKEYDLKGNTLILPESATIKFRRKGKIVNGTIVGSNNVISSSLKPCFGQDVEFEGTFSCDMQYEWLYESNCEIRDSSVTIYGKMYSVKVAIGSDQRNNITSAFKRVSRHFTGLHFNKSYVLENPDGTVNTSNNILRIKDPLENFTISGGIFYNAGFAIYHWHNIVVKDMTIYGRYHLYTDRDMNLDWTSFHSHNGEELCFASVGVHLSNDANSYIKNKGAIIDNVAVYNCYNGIYVGTWLPSPDGQRTVEDVFVTNCSVHDMIYHGYSTCNCHNVIFDRNFAENSYLGMLVDISRGSSNVLFKNGIGKNLPQPFKIALNTESLPTVNCTIDSCVVMVSSILHNCTLGPSVILSGNGTCNITNNSITYNDNYGGTLLSLGATHDSKYVFKGNTIYSMPFYSFMRYTLYSDVSDVEVEFADNIIYSDYFASTVYGIILDDLRQNECDAALNILFNNNQFFFSAQSSVQIPELQMLRRQGYNNFRINGKLYLSDNVIDYPPYNDLTVDLKQEISF